MRIEFAVLLYDRPTHARSVLDGLVANGVGHVRAFVDRADDPAVVARQEAMLCEIDARRDIHVDVDRFPRRFGLAASVRRALDLAFAEADAVVLLEDDCVLRPGGAAYFRDALSGLAGDFRVRSVCGYQYPCEFIHSPGAPMLLRRFCPWGWATWRNRWTTHCPDVSAVVRRLDQRGIVLDDVASDLAALCRTALYRANRAGVWSVPWTLEHFANDQFAVYPGASLIDNIGFDGTGQHCPRTLAFETPAVAPPSGWAWHDLAHDPRNDALLKAFLDVHGRHLYPAA